MKSKSLLILPIAVLAISSLACQFVTGLAPTMLRGSGNLVREERAVSGFSEIDLAGQGNLIIELGQAESLVIEAEDNFLPYIITEVRGQTLVIRQRDNTNFLPKESINLYLTVESLEGINISGLGDVHAPVLTADAFSIAISGGGNLNLEGLEAGELVVAISGLGDVNIGSGTVGSQEITISGGGNYQGERLESRNAGVNISGLGNVYLWASENLSVTISGGGSVHYLGSPSLTQSISGLGNVEKIER